MKSRRPYIMRALYEWILDSECTPYVQVNAMASNVVVPQEYVKDGQIVLNISPLSVIDLLIDNDAMSFNGRFGGVATNIYVPILAVIGIYARENGQGKVFEDEGGLEPGPDQPPTTPRKPSLKVVK